MPRHRVWFSDWILLIHFTSLIKWIQYLLRRLSLHVHLMDFCLDIDKNEKKTKIHRIRHHFQCIHAHVIHLISFIYTFTDCTNV